MCSPYYSQWDKSDLDSWQGKDEKIEFSDTDLCHDDDDTNLDQNEGDDDEHCPRCANGCNYCLMCLL